MAILDLRSVKETSLWQRLKGGFAGAEGDLAVNIAMNLVSICDDELSARMKAIPTLMPQYTLHDEVHALRVTELMWLVMPERVRLTVNPVEIALLILAAFAHDQGMAIEPSDLDSLKSDPDFQLFRENWEIDHPNVADVRRLADDRALAAKEREKARSIDHELHGAMLTDYIRRTHGERSAKFVKRRYASDARIDVKGVNLAEFVARLSASHVQPATQLSPNNGFRFDERIGNYSVNLCYLGAILRLADIMDLDRDRTPDSLYRTISFRSPISLAEWSKHRSVQGWVIRPGLIQYTLSCEHPEYQRAAYHFMDWIDDELAATHELVASFPAAFHHYALDVPLRVDRSRIEPKGNAYIYRDLEFSLSRNEIVSLLMTERLYGGPQLCVRELLQNALDALRYRKAIMRREGMDWKHGQIRFSHELNERGFEVLRCTDNGVGMTEDVVVRFLTRAGRSYYRSPEFEQERTSFRKAGVDFDPCAQFGIGFMSCFMVGDLITIKTRRDYGPSKGHGQPLVIEIDGLGGMLVIRKGDPSQAIGTTVEIQSRKPTSIIDDWDDKVQLIRMLEGYALAAEFPISGSCAIPEITATTAIPAAWAMPPTELETRQDAGHVRTFQVFFSEVNPNLGGVIRATFITDTNKRLIMGDAERIWMRRENYVGSREWRLMQNGVELDGGMVENQIACDGILVAGKPGRADKEAEMGRLGSYAERIGFGRATFLLDVRGSLKPQLTPARTPPDIHWRHGSAAESWRSLERAAGMAWGRLWEQVAALCPAQIDSETFWFLVEMYDGGVLDMRANRLWSAIKIPLVSDGTPHREVAIGEIGPMRAVGEKAGLLLYGTQARLGLNREVTAHDLFSAIVASSQLALAGSEVVFQPCDISTSQTILRDRVISREMVGPLYTIPYTAPFDGFLAVVTGSFATANINHPLVVASKSEPASDSPLARFARIFLYFATDKDTHAWIREGKPVDSWKRRIGKYFESTDWSALDPSLSPPYRIGLEDSQYSVTKSDLVNWSKGYR
jgi:hypothetical protein